MGARPAARYPRSAAVIRRTQKLALTGAEGRAAMSSDTIETRDLAAASAFLTDAIVPCRLAQCQAGPLLARVARCRTGRIGMAEASYGARVRVDTTCRPDEYIVEVWLA